MRTPRDWDVVFMSMAMQLAHRSKDEETQVGALIVDIDHRILSGGFNGPPFTADDSVVPKVRPEKYKWFIHAELNALFFAHCKLNLATMYVTGVPCHNCMLAIAQNGIIRVVFGGKTPQMCDTAEQQLVEEIARTCGVKIEQYKGERTMLD
jgi:dCMP deaminase